MNVRNGTGLSWYDHFSGSENWAQTSPVGLDNAEEIELSVEEAIKIWEEKVDMALKTGDMEEVERLYQQGA